jgi:hypothetical protein
LFGWDDYVHAKMKLLFEQSMIKMDAYNVLPKKVVSALAWISNELIPFMMNMGSMIVLIWIFNRIYGLIGFERTIITLLCIFLAMSRWK